MKSVLSVIALVTAVAALAISVYTQINPPRWKDDFGASSPKAAVVSFMSLVTDDILLYASQAYRAAHRDEILKNLEVIDVSESEDYCIAFIRYSIGTDIFREAYWFGKVDEKWYRIPYFSEYSDSKPADEEWFKKMIDRKKKWEEESAKAKF